MVNNIQPMMATAALPVNLYKPAGLPDLSYRKNGKGLKIWLGFFGISLIKKKIRQRIANLIGDCCLLITAVRFVTRGTFHPVRMREITRWAIYNPVIRSDGYFEGRVHPP